MSRSWCLRGTHALLTHCWNLWAEWPPPLLPHGISNQCLEINCSGIQQRLELMRSTLISSPADVPSSLQCTVSSRACFKYWNKLFCKELMLLVDQSRQRGFLTAPAAQWNRLLLFMPCCILLMELCSVSLCGKGEVPGRDAGDPGAESTEQWGAVLWTTQDVFIVH